MVAYFSDLGSLKRYNSRNLHRFKGESVDLSDVLFEQTEMMVNKCLNQAAEFYETAFPVSAITFDLKGRAAGQVRFPVRHKFFDKKWPQLRFNAELLKQYSEQFINEVVPHECAHVIVYHLFADKFTSKKMRPKPHGSEWQKVMREVFKLEPRVTHNFAVSSLKAKTFEYSCRCEQKIHQVSLIRHNKMKRGTAKYLCRKCGELLMDAKGATESA